MKDERVAELLERLTPGYDDRSGRWESVFDDARPRSRPLRLGIGVAAAATLAVAVLTWPFQAEQGGVLERALAAVGEGPVLHVVLRGEWGGTLVDLRTGARTPVHGENESGTTPGAGSSTRSTGSAASSSTSGSTSRRSRRRS